MPARIEGRLAAVRATAEPPWIVDIRFHSDDHEPDLVDAYVEYWRSVRSWLDDSTAGARIATS
jgi:hypothetical protein